MRFENWSFLHIFTIFISRVEPEGQASWLQKKARDEINIYTLIRIRFGHIEWDFNSNRFRSYLNVKIFSKRFFSSEIRVMIGLLLIVQAFPETTLRISRCDLC